VLWALSFPVPGIAGFAWAVPGLLLALTSGQGAGSAFRTAYLAGAVHYLVSLSWLRHIPFPAGAFAAWFALALFLALLPPLWVWTCWRFARRLDLAGTGPHLWKAGADRLAASSWLRLNAWFLLCAASWVASEMLLARLFGGFPWNLLGASQHRMLPLIQMASFTGVYGVSFVVAWFSVSLFAAVLLLLRDPDRPIAWRRPLLFPALIVVAITGSGFLTILRTGPAPKSLKVALVQPSIPQTVIFDPDASTNRFETLYRLTDQALTTQPDLLLWPEASLPGGLGRDSFDRLARRVREAGAWMIFGSDEIEEVPDAADPERVRAFNSAFLLDPEGRVTGSYRKRRLVMFGEYIPFGRWFPFLQRLAPIGDGFEAGESPVSFPLANLGVTASVVICFEDNFAHQTREHAPPGVDLLVNLTNDGWFGRSSAQWQHNANATFRAVENGLPLVRCSNNGISCWIDPLGRVHSTRLREGRDAYDAGFETLTVTCGMVGRTLYNRVGDLFGWLCVAATLAALLPRRTPPATAATSNVQRPTFKVER
jgi:apolipoprotein N-acyltransferase